MADRFAPLAGRFLLVRDRRLARLGDRLAGFFPEAVAICPGPALQGPIAILASPGSSGYAAAVREARRRDVPLVRVFPGLIHAIAPSDSGAPPLDLLADLEADIHDPRLPSGLERRLQAGGWTPDALLAAETLLAAKQRGRLARDSGATLADLPAAGEGDRLLLADQSADDPALTALPDWNLAVAALSAAVEALDGPVRIVLLRPPGGRGVVEAALRRVPDAILDRGCDLVELMGRIDRCWTISAQAGLEAVLAGRAVSAFGAAYWTGWGLTRDAQATPRRWRRLSVIELFAGLLEQWRFVDPHSGAPAPAGQALATAAALRIHAVRVAGHWRGVRLPPPKHQLLARFLSGPFSTYARRAPDTAAERERVVAWAGPAGRAPPGAAIPSGATLAEDGFIRSSGLGARLVPAASICLDACGVHYDSQRESDLETLLQAGGFDPALLARAARLRGRIVEAGVSKYNLPRATSALPASGARRRLLVPGQVEDDASVLLAGDGWTNLRLLKAVRAENPDAFIVYKPHPDVVLAGRRGALADGQLTGLADAVAGEADILSLIEAVDEVHTLTSLAGFEALLRARPVRLHGRPFYGAWGLTSDARAWPRPRRRLSLDELVAGALILYPLYLHPVSGLPCSPEALVEALSAAGPDRAATIAGLAASVLPSRRALY
ncbi:MAG TPA: hypothetical protein VG248_15230 [Caulobacteraceae bacterium]|nr:hypothetical protein [Caulobacteraceae bacterium]